MHGAGDGLASSSRTRGSQSEISHAIPLLRPSSCLLLQLELARTPPYSAFSMLSYSDSRPTAIPVILFLFLTSKRRPGAGQYFSTFTPTTRTGNRTAKCSMVLPPTRGPPASTELFRAPDPQGGFP